MRDGRGWLLWAALAVALSASLADLAVHVAASPWARATALFFPLFAYTAWQDPAPARPSRVGPLWVALGLAVSLIGVAGGMTRTGRPGIALAAIGLARALGRPTLPRALVAAWVVPVPTALQAALAPGLAGLVAAAMQRAGALLDVASRVDPHRTDRIVFAVPAGSLDLFPGDAGLPLAWTLAGIGWFAAVQHGGGIAGATRLALRGVLAGFAIQTAALALACGLALSGALGAARVLLDQLVLAVALAALALALRPRAGTLPA